MAIVLSVTKIKKLKRSEIKIYKILKQVSVFFSEKRFIKIQQKCFRILASAGIPTQANDTLEHCFN